MSADGAREYVRALLCQNRSKSTGEIYERMLYRLHVHTAPQEPYDAPDLWLADVRGVCKALSEYSLSSQLKHVSVIIELLRCTGDAALERRYVQVRESGAE